MRQEGANAARVQELKPRASLVPRVAHRREPFQQNTEAMGGKSPSLILYRTQGEALQRRRPEFSAVPELRVRILANLKIENAAKRSQGFGNVCCSALHSFHLDARFSSPLRSLSRRLTTDPGKDEISTHDDGDDPPRSMFTCGCFDRDGVQAWRPEQRSYSLRAQQLHRRSRW